MEVYECIKTRRSVRKFLDKVVSPDLINKLIDAARNAPSSMDSQPWEFIIVKSKELKQKIASLKDEDNRQHILTAPVVIVVCSDTNKSPTRYIEDAVAAAENILLMAHDLGLGGVYVTGFKPSKPEIAESIQSTLNIPKNIQPIIILPIGYPDTSEKIEDKELRETKELIHEDGY